MAADPEALTTTQQLLAVLAEECSEVAQRVTKALRFGLREVQPGQSLDNEARIAYELCDILGTLSLLQERGLFVGFPEREAHKRAIEDKREKVVLFLRYAGSLGMVRRDG